MRIMKEKLSKKEKPKFKERWHTFWHTPLKQHIKNSWAWIKPYVTTWQGLVGMLLAWCIVDGWTYLAIAIGSVKHIPWLLSIGLVAEAILWQPWTIEKPLVVIPLGILFKKLLDKWFPSKKKVDKVYNVDEEKKMGDRL